MSQPHAAHTNALIHETSPYLLQHAHNPVDWQPWSSETLRRARQEDKPILLSIGYSACHWCHVMAHESFEDPQTAELMNRLYVNVKVDREERPDLDKIYQTAHYLLARRNGGWPLTVFLMPDDQTPFFGGTYFPREERHGLPSFRQVLVRVAEFFAQHRDELVRQNASLRQALASEHLVSGGDGVVLGPLFLDAAREALGRDFDRRHGGFGRAPKFPRPTSVERLLRHYALSLAGGEGDKGALSMADETLRAMAQGGIDDQVGGGFCRYSVDDQWMIPHFEKMLYDNGPLLDLYTRAWQLTREPLFERTARGTAQWVMREMQSPEGGYYATLDADSEGEEGRFYLWTPQEVADLLDAEQYRVWAMHVGLDRAPNFEGRWYPHVFQDEAAVARAVDLPVERVQALLDAARERLFAARERRVRPGRDEKVLTGWNGLMIAAMATAGRVFEEPRYIESAERAVEFVRERLWDGERLLAGYKDGRAHLAAYLDDHVFLMAGLLSLLEARWRAADLDLAVRLADRVLARFEDRERGGFFFTADDHEALIHRPKPLADEALPSGNGIAVQVLLRLGSLLGEPRYLAAAENALKNAWPVLEHMPHAHEALLAGLEEQLHPVQVVVLRGAPRALAEWRGRLARDYAPRRLVLPIASDAEDLPPALAGKVPQGEVTAYVCAGQTCSPPLTSEDALAALVGQNDV